MSLNDEIETDRRRAARFYYKAGCAGYVEDWIASGEDEGNEVDRDVKDMAAVLAMHRVEAYSCGYLDGQRAAEKEGTGR